MSIRRTLDAWGVRAGTDVRRHRPRVIRLAVLIAKNIFGVCRALLLRLRLWARPLLEALVARPRGARAAIWIADRARTRRVVVGALLAGLLGWLIGPTTTLGSILAVPVLGWASLLGWVAF